LRDCRAAATSCTPQAGRDSDADNRRRQKGVAPRADAQRMRQKDAGQDQCEAEAWPDKRYSPAGAWRGAAAKTTTKSATRADACTKTHQGAPDS
jgi:hypothetical protein